MSLVFQLRRPIAMNESWFFLAIEHMAFVGFIFIIAFKEEGEFFSSLSIQQSRTRTSGTSF